MTNSTEKSEQQSEQTTKTNPSPWRCLMGSLISGSMAIPLYLLTSSIANSFATKPISSTNTLVLKIASAVRTLVLGVSALGTGIFGLVAIGLFALAIQISVQRITSSSS